MLKEICLTTKRGFSLNAIDGDSITEEIKNKGEYDSNTLCALEDILSQIKPEVSLDIGANIGNHSLLISKLSKKLIAFEPVDFLFDLLRQNVESNCNDNTVIFNLGLSNKNCKTDIFIPRNGNLGSSSINQRVGEGGSLTIRLVEGDDFLVGIDLNSGIDFIKIDVEGHEAEALEGLFKTVIKNQPLILIEWKSDRTIKLFAEKKLFNCLFEGYKFYSLTRLDNKKANPRTLTAFFKRIFCKLIYKKWCLSEFSSSKHYSNVFFVPQRYCLLFEQFRNLKH